NRVGGLIVRLANAGARNFLVPNVPPLGAVPNSFGDPTRVLALDYASAIYRDHLKSVIASTKSGLHGSGITIQVYPFDVWLDLVRVLGQPAHTTSSTQLIRPKAHLGSIRINIFSGMISIRPLVV